MCVTVRAGCAGHAAGAIRIGTRRWSHSNRGPPLEPFESGYAAGAIRIGARAARNLCNCVADGPRRRAWRRARRARERLVGAGDPREREQRALAVAPLDRQQALPAVAQQRQLLRGRSEKDIPLLKTVANQSVFRREGGEGGVGWGGRGQRRDRVCAWTPEATPSWRTSALAAPTKSSSVKRSQSITVACAGEGWEGDGL